MKIVGFARSLYRSKLRDVRLSAIGYRYNSGADIIDVSFTELDDNGDPTDQRLRLDMTLDEADRIAQDLLSAIKRAKGQE